MNDDRNPERDGGFTLIELLVGLGLMSVVMVMVLGGVIEVYSNVTRTDGVATTREQITTSFRRLDKDIRYASWIDPPGKVNGNYYVEYNTPTGCRQLAYKSGVLTLASWNSANTNTPGTPSTIATDLTLTGTTDPFTVIWPGDSPYATASPGTTGTGTGYVPQHSQIRLRFTSKYANTTMPVDELFTAQNTMSYNVFGNNRELLANDCSKGRPTS